MALSASDLAKRHNLEGAPDPFPAMVDKSPARPKKSPQTALDTDSASAFPALAPSAPTAAAPARSAWGAGGPRIKPAVVKAPVYTDTFTLTSVSLPTNKDGKTLSLSEVLKQVMAKHKVRIDASGQKGGQTFYLRGESPKELDKGKRSLLASLSPVISIVVDAPASTIPTIIGPKGVTLKQIRDQTNVKIDIPRREDTLNVPNGQANGHASGKATPVEDDEEEPTIPITVQGPETSVYEAKALLNQIIATKTSKTTQRVRDIPAHILPFIAIRESYYKGLGGEGNELHFSFDFKAREVTASGDREAVVAVIESVKASIEGHNSTLTSFKLNLPKRQHVLLRGDFAKEILLKSQCSISVPPAEDATDEIIVWGKQTDLAKGMEVALSQANSKYIHDFPVPSTGPGTAKQVVTYMTRIGYTRILKASHPGVSVYLPSPEAANLSIVIAGDKPAVDGVINNVSALMGKLFSGTKEVPIDWLLHRIIQGKNAKKIKQFHEQHNVQVLFPPESQELSSVLLVYDPLSPNFSVSLDDKLKHLDDVSKDLLKFARDAADVKSEQVSVEKRWHSAVVGVNKTTLNAIIGEDKTLSIKVGAEAKADSEDVIFVRGASADVDRAVKEILQIVEDAKHNEIDNSYVTDFDIDREYVGRIVGSQGSGINRLRDLLGVKVDVSDEETEKDKEGGKKKKAVHQKAKVTIVGRKENVEEAKKRILGQVERLADETQEILKIPSQYHSSLIGQSGKYAIRLEEHYSVKITFPRQNESGEGKTREQLKSDEVLIKGGRKGVAQAKKELLDAVEFEKESNNVIKFTVPNRAVPRILGRGGVSINDIKDSTSTQIDVDEAEDSDGALTQISIRGSKKGIAEAKAAILAISDQVQEETTAVVPIENKYHRTLIGGGGQGLRDLIARCGGPTDPKLQAGLVRFPRPGETGDEVRIRGEPKLVNKLKVELEKAAEELRARIVLAVEVPAQQHRALIGRGGQHLNEMQNRTGAQVQFPGSRSYNQVGEPENASDMEGVDPANIVKVSGSRAACEKAVEELKSQVKKVPPPVEMITDTITVPLKYHHAISQQGGFFRGLRAYGVQVDQSAVPKKSAVPARPATNGAASSEARIDDAADEETPAVQWEVIPNYQDAEEGDSVWTLKARDQEGLDKAKSAVEDAVKAAERMSHVGFLTMPDRSTFPRIVGSKGSTVARLRNETGADITVSRENSTIVIIGSQDDIVAAKDAILRMVSDNGRGGRRRD
ncbi:hypothetical protein BD626DRAFT_392577 [Schizophyllum amplum]|uniref:K Homology domain-containing protein n=1 Tax=Schizophyllum amplum TaxID=97359 RepID=A0A550CXF0_9AGAR|nr:hypothetical protein BD626DRAFT_392577 [Auriculariopsis ampla]